MLQVDAIDTFYGETQALFGVSLSVGAGEVLALLGANGAGKTTLLRSVLGLTRPRRGDIRFRDRAITRRPTHEIARAGIGWVPDDRRLCPTLTVARNLSLGIKATGFRPWTMDEVTEIFSPLKYLMAREAETLSGGEMQMVAIARALLGAPGLVLFDEPSQGLAPKIVDDVMAVIGRLRAEGIASIVVEQNAEVALAVADRVVVLSRGQVAWSGTAAALAADQPLRQRLVGGLQ
ncbi:branched-chain amino acid transport system ATP-binding protein [Stella humosa]|uniref:Branched-chain amino acid transport system ATP-binding protein n=1 Tax=Stella humosa TaxID=94 RepID=A0A3N1MA38_9PROT|nr:ABC transporter ATP-binding protein [Stella humosa]ROQ00498.1 branched-chain amino acid transport system ATP-binding protein [Stella humosa]BBK30258.1 ABC transporter ATP-binding protein [Stella humosa]